MAYCLPQNDNSAPRNDFPLRTQPGGEDQGAPTAGGPAATPASRCSGGLPGAMLQHAGGAGHDVSCLRGYVAKGL
jgi:hypothetical protein